MRLVVLLIGLGIPSLDVGAQQVTELVRFTNTWRYNNLRTDLGTAWRARAYVDTTWASGAALLGQEDSVPSPYGQHGLTVNSIDIGPNPGRTPTIYFRTHFTSPVAGNTPGVSLIMSNLVDDGCVIYLNGSEAGRVRVAANQTYATFATGGTEGALETVVINPALLTAGDNVLAVEVHNGATDSSDLVYGARVMLFRQTALSITNQPQNETVVLGETASFTVGVSGGPVTYRWYRGTVPQPSTSNTLNIVNAQVANAGTNYYVVVSNIINVVTSRLATLTVVADLEGPNLVAAIINNAPPGGGTSFGTNTINVLFDETLNTAVPITHPQNPRNTNNYRLVSATNSNIQIPILSVLYSSALGALINVDGTNPNWDPTRDYFLIVNNVADVRGNTIAPNSMIGVSILVTTNLTQMSDEWNFHAMQFFDPDIYSTQWYGTNYIVDLSAGLWASGGGLLFVDPNPPAVVTCANETPQTLISFQNPPTLFRRTFTLPSGVPTSGTFRFRFVVDDGMVLYLNGREIHRQNVAPGGPVNENTRAIVNVAGFACVTNLSINVSNLHTGSGNVRGTNVLAAAVCQSATPESDTWFGLEMDWVTVRTPAVPPPAQLTMNRQACALRLSWPTNLVGYTLQTKTNLNAAWVQVPNQSNPYTNVNSCVGNRFFRLFKP